ncbi:GNAT family N-acetyltransferase [Acutalibacter sp. 1XD8-33]|uniref:GNAT family N-acetyltransferase n=1 Tax=Acutalibacter sp. 1XD8-33 TaxID=2320081 RepID=UPI001314B69F|nr:GNAT family N-acetyltransferase [Acutalibacter sp. 1XD8-33]
MEKRQAWRAGIRQLAVDFNTTPEALLAGGILFTPPALNPGRRAYSDKLPFFELVTTGTATVIMAEEELWSALQEWAKDAEEPHWLLEFPRMWRLAEILSPYGYALTQTFHHYLPGRDFRPAKAPEGLTLQWLEREDIANFYPNASWPNALQEEENPARPDVLALLALDGDKPAALAGASADAPGMWQVGIDVLPPYRGRGLGALLVEGLCHEVERRGALPFYGTSLSNLHSQNIAWKCGFRPAWVTVSAKRRKKNAEKAE